MQETVLTTLIYKYNPYARFWVVLYVVSMFLLCVFASDKLPLYIIWVALCLWAIPLVYAGISKKTIFNFRAIDSRLLTVSPSHIKVGRERFAIGELSVEVHLYAYDGFIYRIRREGLLKPQATYGVNNELLFTYKGQPYDYEFHLRDYNDYTMLCQVMDQWKAAGINVNIKETFTREFVDKQYARMNQEKKKH
jgi:hypothetical protein